MYLDRGILCTDRGSDGLSTRPHWPNALTGQSAGTKDAPRDPFLWLRYMESFLGTDHPCSMSMSTSTSMSVSTSIFAEYSPKSRLPLSLHRHAKSCQWSDATTIIGIGSFALTTGFASTRLDSPFLAGFNLQFLFDLNHFFRFNSTHV